MHALVIGYLVLDVKHRLKKKKILNKQNFCKIEAELVKR
jgi:hypothetical protein